MYEIPLVPPNPSKPPPKPPRSALVPVGIAFVVGGLALPRPLTLIAEAMPDGLVKALVFIGTDVFRLCFFVGVTMIILGALRNRTRR